MWGVKDSLGEAIGREVDHVLVSCRDPVLPPSLQIGFNIRRQAGLDLFTSILHTHSHAHTHTHTHSHRRGNETLYMHK